MTRASRRFLASVAAVCAALALSGCSGAPESANLGAWEAPGWMAEAVARRENMNTRLDACMRAKGFEFTRDGDAIVWPDDGAPEFHISSAAMEACLNEMGYALPTEWSMTDEQVRQWFAYEVDRFHCFAAHGVDVTPPPSEDSWVDDVFRAMRSGSASGYWMPSWDDAAAIAAGLGSVEWEHLRTVTCPDPAMPLPRLDELPDDVGGEAPGGSGDAVNAGTWLSESEELLNEDGLAEFVECGHALGMDFLTGSHGRHLIRDAEVAGRFATADELQLLFSTCLTFGARHDLPGLYCPEFRDDPDAGPMDCAAWRVFDAWQPYWAGESQERPE